MVDPVATVNGNVYDREFITKWLEDHSLDPLTNEHIAVKLLVPMHHLKRMAAAWRADHPDHLDVSLASSSNYSLVLGRRDYPQL